MLPKFSFGETELELDVNQSTKQKLQNEFKQINYAKEIDIVNRRYLGALTPSELVNLGQLKDSIRLLRKILQAKNMRTISSELQDFKVPDPAVRHILLKELLCCEDFSAQMLKMSRSVVLKDIAKRLLISPTSVISFILNSDRSFLLSKAFSNLLVCCRMLPPRYQVPLYHNMHHFIEYGKTMAEIHGQDWPDTDELVSCLFEFDVAPVSYSHSAEKVRKNRFSFFETLWSELPLILRSLLRSGFTKDQCLEKVKFVWDAVKSQKFEGESWGHIARRIAKGKSWIPEGDSWDIFHDLSKRLFSESEHSDLYLFIEVFLLFQDNRRVHAIIQAYRDHSEKGKKIQLLLSQVFKRMADQRWTHELLVFAKVLHKNSPKYGKHVILAGYKGFEVSKESVIDPMHIVDIAEGMKTDSVGWMTAFEKFKANSKFLKSRKAYDYFYRVLKHILEYMNAEENEKDYRLVSEAFIEILLVVRKASSDDWKLLSNVTELKDIERLIIDVPDLYMGEESIRKLSCELLSKSKPESLTFYAVLRLLETSQEPAELCSSILATPGSMLRTRSPDISIGRSPSFWLIVKKIAELGQTVQVHQQLSSYIFKVAKHLNIRISINHPGVAKSLAVIISSNLCNDETQRLLSLISDLRNNGATGIDAVYYLTLILITSPTEYKQPTNSYWHGLKFVQAARFMNAHKGGESLDIEHQQQLCETVNNIWRSAQATSYDLPITCCLIVIDLMREFHQEPYFQSTLEKLSISKLEAGSAKHRWVHRSRVSLKPHRLSYD
jgi:hypothetical protein